MQLLAGKVAIVTGSGSGIGRGVALCMARAGAKVCVADVQVGAGQETVGLIQQEGGQAVFVETDVSRSEDARRLVEKTVETFGKLDILVNNAGVMHNASVVEETEDGWDRILNINLKGVFNCSKYAVPEMMKQKGGAIINIGSVTGILGYPNLSAYCASKGGVISLTRAMAMDYAAHNIRVNSINPGTIDTPILHRFLETAKNPESARQSFIALHPIGRLGTPEDIGHAAVFLASDWAAFITGHALVVDGGFSVRGEQPTE